MGSHTKFGPNRFSHFEVYWIQTKRQTNRQKDRLNLYKEEKYRYICKTCNLQIKGHYEKIQNRVLQKIH